MGSFVYLDESGDTGFRFDRGSSSYFVVALLVVEDPDPIHEMIERIRSDLGFGPRGEFKFSHSADSVRRRYLSSLCSQSISIYGHVFDKRRLAVGRSITRDLRYRELVDLVLRHNREILTGATLILDETVRDKRRRDDLASELKRTINAGTSLISADRLRYHASHRDNLIQAADMVSGAIYRKYHRNDDTYYRIIMRRVENLVEWPPTATETS